MNLEVQTIIERGIIFIVVFAAFAISLLLTLVFFYLLVIFSRMKKREQMSLEMMTLEVRMSKDNEIKIDAAEQLFSAFSSLKKSGFFSFMDVEDVISLEIVGKKADIRFYVSVPTKICDMVEKQIYGYYPQADIRIVEEPNIFSEKGNVSFAAVRLKGYSYEPIKTFRDLPTDPLAAITSALSKMDEGDGAMIQILIRPANSSWKKLGKSYVSSVKKKEASPEKATFKIDQKTLEKIDDKTSHPGFETVIRMIVSSKTKETAKVHLRNIRSAFSQFASDLNSFTSVKILSKGGFMLNCVYRFFPIIDFSFARSISILSSDEIATLFHFPNKTI